MCEMLANKYLAEGNLEKATEAFERILPATRSVLYSLLICYAMQGRCQNVRQTAQRIIDGGGPLDLAAIRAYRLRFTDGEITRLMDRLEGLCFASNQDSALLNRLILAELAGDSQEADRCRLLLRFDGAAAETARPERQY